MLNQAGDMLNSSELIQDLLDSSLHSRNTALRVPDSSLKFTNSVLRPLILVMQFSKTYYQSRNPALHLTDLVLQFSKPNLQTRTPVLHFTDLVMQFSKTY